MCLDSSSKFSHSSCDHINLVMKVLKFFREAGATLKPRKFIFTIGTAQYHANLICLQHLEIATSSTDAPKKLNLPPNISNFSSAVELIKVFPRFRPYASRIAAAINNSLENDKQKCFKVLIALELRTLHKLQKVLVCPTTLAFHKAIKKYRLDANACNMKI